MPPGVHLKSEVVGPFATGPVRYQLRILGDPTRGYLLAGLSSLPAAQQGEFWFESLEAAKRAAQAYGVPLDSWTEITTVGEVAEPWQRNGRRS